MLLTTILIIGFRLTQILQAFHTLFPTSEHDCLSIEQGEELQRQLSLQQKTITTINAELLQQASLLQRQAELLLSVQDTTRQRAQVQAITIRTLGQQINQFEARFTQHIVESRFAAHLLRNAQPVPTRPNSPTESNNSDDSVHTNPTEPTRVPRGHRDVIFITDRRPLRVFTQPPPPTEPAPPYHPDDTPADAPQAVREPTTNPNCNPQ